MQLRCRCIYGKYNKLTRFKLVSKKHVYGGFIKVINKQSLRAKKAEVCLCSKLVETKQSSQCERNAYQPACCLQRLRNKVM